MSNPTTVRPAKKRKLPAPPCPRCGDRHNLFVCMDAPTRLYCWACEEMFDLAEILAPLGEWAGAVEYLLARKAGG